MQEAVATSTATPEAKAPATESSSTPVSSPAPESVPPTEEAKAEEDNISRRFSILAKQERKLLEQKQSIARKEAELARKEAEYKELETDPFGFLEKKGHTYQKWTEKILGQDGNEPASEIKSLRDEIKSLREEREAEKKNQERAKAENEWNSYRGQAKSVIEATEDFELLKHEGESGVEHVLAYMVEYNSKFGKPPTFEEACKAIETHLEKQAEGLVKLKKFQKWAQPKEATDSTESPKPASGPTAQRPTTLTNDMSAQGSKPMNSRRLLTREESLAEAAKLIRFID